ncbi:MAG: alpha/beta hydrolase [Promethearchaeota archaeon]
MAGFFQFRLRFSDVTLRVVGARATDRPAPDPEEPPFLLLHGFPEFWYSWRRLMPLLVEGGAKPRRAYALDQRGFGASSKPKRVRAYRLELLAKDVARVIGRLSPRRREAYLVGHDWGGAVAWEVARRYPGRVKRLWVLNCPPVEVLLKAVRELPRQFLMSWYVYFFQLPFLPEHFLSGRGASRVIKMMGAVRAGPGGSRTPVDELERYRAAYSQPRGASGINYYRAAVRSALLGQAWSGRRGSPAPKVRCPTRVIWGARDLALSTELVRYFPPLVEPGKLRFTFLPRASHFVQLDHPEQCAAAILGDVEPC